MRWGDVDWSNGRLTVHRPKTEHHPGGGPRVTPLYHELHRYLDEMWQDAADGEEFVITRCRGANANLRTQLERNLRRAGLKPRPKLSRNLRVTRQTELTESYPVHVVTSWIGNNAAIVAKHYLQVTEEHFGVALARTKRRKTRRSKPAQIVAKNRTPRASRNKKPRFFRGLRHLAVCCKLVQCPLKDSNLEPSD